MSLESKKAEESDISLAIELDIMKYLYPLIDTEVGIRNEIVKDSKTGEIKVTVSAEDRKKLIEIINKAIEEFAKEHNTEPNKVRKHVIDMFEKLKSSSENTNKLAPLRLELLNEGYDKEPDIR